jgi:hypothetical protein
VFAEDELSADIILASVVPGDLKISTLKITKISDDLFAEDADTVEWRDMDFGIISNDAALFVKSIDVFGVPDFSGTVGLSIDATVSNARRLRGGINLVVQPKQKQGKIEKPFFSEDPDACEIGYITNADGTIKAYLRIPYLPGADPTKIYDILATLSGIIVSNMSYSSVDTHDVTVPIEAATKISDLVQRPYLQIAFAAPSLDALENGVLEIIEYLLKGDAAEYVQAYANGGMKFPDIPWTDETPSVSPEDPYKSGDSGCGGGGCQLGLGFGTMALSLALTAKRRK